MKLLGIHSFLLLQSLCCFALSLNSVSTSCNYSCPEWTLPKVKSNSSDVECVCKNKLYYALHCVQSSLDIYVLLFHCLTFNSVFNTTVIGNCLYNVHGHPYIFNNYWLLTHDNVVSRNGTVLCGFIENVHSVDHHAYQHNTGQMCSSCDVGYGYPVYSYSLSCVECKNYRYNWLKYLAITFLPLTIFYALVVIFRITATSGAMNGYVFMCQIIGTPISLRLSTKIRIKPGPPATSEILQNLYISFIGIHNLDFFRSLYPPFCLHPKSSALQILLLDYVVAVYPLLLIVITFFCVKLHSRYSLVVRLCRPFYGCFAVIRNKWDINRSLVGAFATFMLLSYVKILNVSFYALIPNSLYDIDGNKMPKTFLYYDGSYEYFGRDHIPYALLAIFMLLVFNIIPMLLLCLYPCRCFHRCLNHCRFHCLALHIFMDTFTGCYKIEPRDNRCFAAVLLFLRLVNHTLLAVTVGPSYLPLAGFVILITSVVVAIVRPQKSLLHTIADTVFLTSLSVLLLGLSAYRLVQDFGEGYNEVYLYVLTFTIAAIPLLYGIGLVIFYITPMKCLLKLKVILRCCVDIMTGNYNKEAGSPVPYRLEHSDEYPPLLPLPIGN